jgi:periplasmic protein TonB
MNPMHSSADWYSPREIALAAGVPVERVLAEVRAPYVPHEEAVRIGRSLRRRPPPLPPPTALFAVVTGDAGRRPTAIPLAVSGTLHALLIVIVFVVTLNLSPKAAVLGTEERAAQPVRLIFLTTPGPAGGGGGGGLVQRQPAPKAERLGRSRLSSPMPERREPRPIEPVPKPPEPKPDPPLAAEQLPTLVAPIVAAPADAKTRIGVFESSASEADSHGQGRGGGAGTGTGTGLGGGDGSGLGPGSGGGTGGGPYRPGSGITPPRLLREVKADYTEDARQRGISGDVVLEIVVRRDGSVGDTRVLQGLGGGLNDRALQAVRQWRFAPAQRQGAPVDVIVEVAVEFKLR